MQEDPKNPRQLEIEKQLQERRRALGLETTKKVRESGGVSRRTFLRWLAAGAGAAVGGGVSRLLNRPSDSEATPASTPQPTEPIEPTRATEQIPPPQPEIPIIEQEELKFSLGEEQRVFEVGLPHCPDGQITVVNIPDSDDQSKVVSLIPAGVSTIRFQGGWDNPFGQPTEVYAPGGSIEGKPVDYSGITSVIQRGGEWFGTAHLEEHPVSGEHLPFVARVALVTSTDQGKTWQHIAILCNGVRPDHTRADATGAGQPNMIIDEDGFVRIFYTEWRGDMADQVNCIRARLDEIDKPEAWKAWDGNDFNLSVDDPSTKPVISPRPDKDYWLALPQISWNDFLETYIAICDAKDGFVLCTSPDLTHWSEPVTLLEKDPDSFMMYASLVTTGKDSHQSGKTGTLYYGRGQSGSPHFLHSRQFEFA